MATENKKNVRITSKQSYNLKSLFQSLPHLMFSKKNGSYNVKKAAASSSLPKASPVQLVKVSPLKDDVAQVKSDHSAPLQNSHMSMMLIMDHMMSEEYRSRLGIEGPGRKTISVSKRNDFITQLDTTKDPEEKSKLIINALDDTSGYGTHMLFSCLKELNKRNPILPKELIDRKKFNPDHPKASEKLRKLLHDAPNPKLVSDFLVKSAQLHQMMVEQQKASDISQTKKMNGESISTVTIAVILPTSNAALPTGGRADEAQIKETQRRNDATLKLVLDWPKEIANVLQKIDSLERMLHKGEMQDPLLDIEQLRNEVENISLLGSTISYSKYGSTPDMVLDNIRDEVERYIDQINSLTTESRAANSDTHNAHAFYSQDGHDASEKGYDHSVESTVTKM